MTISLCSGLNDSKRASIYSSVGGSGATGFGGGIIVGDG